MEQEFNALEEKSLKHIYPEIEKIISRFFEELAMEEIDRCQNLINSYNKIFTNYKSKINNAIQNESLPALYFENSNQRQQVLTELESIFQESADDEYENRIGQLIEDCYNNLEQLPEQFKAIQDENRFQKLEGDKAKIVYLKKAKKVARSITKASTSIYNLPRKLFGLKPVQSEWKQKAPLRNLVFTHFVLNNISQQYKALDSFYSSISNIYVELWENDTQINYMIGELLTPDFDLHKFKNSLIEISKLRETATQNKELNNILDSLRKTVNEINSDSIKEVKKNCLIAGTIEQKGSFYSNEKLKIYGQSTTKKFIKTQNQWNKTYFVLADDWKLELEIYALSCLVYKDYHDLANTIRARLVNVLCEYMEEFLTLVNDSKEIFEKIESDKDLNLVKDIKELKGNLKRNLNLKLVPAIKELIIQSDIPTYIDSMEKVVRQQFEKLSKKRLLAKSAEYSKPISSSEIESISPYLLVTFEMQPQFMKAFPSLKNAIITFINKLQIEIEEIPEILDFSLETSISHYQTEKNKEESLKISYEGFQRSAKKSEEINNRLNQFIETEGQNFRESIAKLINDLIEVTNNENALQIKFRITKAKAIEKAKAIRADILNRVKKFIPLLILKLRKVLRFLKFSSQKIKEQFDAESQQDFISTEISDYLSETETALNKLPFVYQRLFKIEPLQSFELFVERPDPLDILNHAHTKWSNGKFAPVVIIGEKGSGKTTLVNRFQKLDGVNEKVKKIDLFEKFQEPENLYKYLFDIASKELKENEESEKEIKTIIIVDGIEKLFYAMVDGFEYMKKTFQLISDTNNTIFWIFTCHKYSWNYINRCISASDYFAYHIKLSDISDKDLKEIIKKRNSISGYNLIFNPGKQDKKSLAFRKSRKEPDQEELEKEYFVHLNQITGGNIAIALQYWMQSTEKVTEDTIFIKSLRDVDLKFIESISKQKYLAIRTILIHNGISIENYSRLFRISTERSTHVLNQLYNDGILIKKDDIFYVNLLIYSQLIAYLKKLNLLS